MRRFIKDVQEAIIPRIETGRFLVICVGIATLFCGFLLGAIINIYLLAIASPLATTFRTTLTYKSAIFGDGIILPVVNMVVISFLLTHKQLMGKGMLGGALFSGFLITTFFHVNQAVHGLVNWTMPTPWHWNVLGVGHALYMFSVASFLSCFYAVLFKDSVQRKSIAQEAIFVTLGLAIFFALLKLDYVSVDISSLIPHF